MTQTLQAGVLRESGIALFATFVLGYHLVVRRSRRRRIVALELRLESAWENFRVTWGIWGARKNIALASPFLGGLQAGPQGRVLSMHVLAAPAVKQPEQLRLPLAGAAAAGAEPGVSSPAPIETVQQTQISCDI